MKIVFLNTWGGRVAKPLENFFRKHQDVDIFCLQEVYDEAHGKDTVWQDANFSLINDIQKILMDYNLFFHPSLGDWWGLATFIKKNVDLVESGEYFVHKFKGYDLEKERRGFTAKNLQYFTFESRNEKYSVVNFHGLWNGQGKGDTDDRLKQSENIISFLKELGHPVILGGDFNLSPDTQSLKAFEDFGLRNLIKENNVTSTRTSFYPKENKFADYVFVSPEITISDFLVMPEEVSDHAALCVTIDL